eukprot:g45456.t1
MSYQINFLFLQAAPSTEGQSNSIEQGSVSTVGQNIVQILPVSSTGVGATIAVRVSSSTNQEAATATLAQALNPQPSVGLQQDQLLPPRELLADSRPETLAELGLSPEELAVAAAAEEAARFAALEEEAKATTVAQTSLVSKGAATA